MIRILSHAQKDALLEMLGDPYIEPEVLVSQQSSGALVLSIDPGAGATTYLGSIAPDGKVTK